MAKRYPIDDLESIQKQFEEMFLERDTYFLLVDRQIGARRGLKNTLIAIGIEDHYIIDVNDGMDATIQASRNTNSFVVFTELKLPDTDAGTMAKRIRSKPGHENDLVILITADKSKDRIEQALQAGVNVYLPKPYTDVDIANLLNKLKLV